MALEKQRGTHPNHVHLNWRIHLQIRVLHSHLLQHMSQTAIHERPDFHLAGTIRRHISNNTCVHVHRVHDQTGNGPNVAGSARGVRRGCVHVHGGRGCPRGGGGRRERGGRVGRRVGGVNIGGGVDVAARPVVVGRAPLIAVAWRAARVPEKVTKF